MQSLAPQGGRVGFQQSRSSVGRSSGRDTSLLASGLRHRARHAVALAPTTLLQQQPGASRHASSIGLQPLRAASGWQGQQAACSARCVAQLGSRHNSRLVLQAAAVDAAAAAPDAAAAVGPERRILQGVSAQRVQRLETLVELKKLYRNIIRAEQLLALPTPAYTPPPKAGPSDEQPASTAAAAASSDSYSSTGGGSPDGSRSTLQDDEEAERVQQAVVVVAEMQLTAEQLKTGLRTLPAGFVTLLLFSPDAAEGVEAAVRNTAKRLCSELKARAAAELQLLPFSSEAKAQAACDMRNSRYDRRLQAAVEELADGSNSLPDRLNQAEKVAGKFVERRIRPALQRAREKDLPELLSESRQYLSGLWSRLNGTAGRSKRALPQELVLPPSSKKGVDKRINELRLKLEGLDKRLVEASKAREGRLRKAGAAGRVAVAIQLRTMDAEVVAISRLLAVGALQLEMEYIFNSLEEEALEISADELRNNMKGPALARENTTGELALLVAEYGLLLQQLDVLAESISSQMGPDSSSSGHSHSAAPQPAAAAAAAGAASSASSKAPGLSIINDDLLTELAAEIPDLRYRVGVSDGEVFGVNPLSPTRLKLQVRESYLKVLEGLSFLTRGVRLLLSDVGSSGRLFTKAALGGTLRPREVAALRRTARDVFSFIPFVIILIVPLTPLGHVLVFGFIQRYFPGFFPSQFTNQRQDLMMRYEELQRQLVDAQAAAELEEDEAELKRAAAAVARLTAPEGYDSSSGTAGSTPSRPAAAAAAASGGSGGSTRRSSAASTRLNSAQVSLDAAVAAAAAGSSDDEGAGPAAAKLRMLEQELEEARQEVHDAPDEESPPPGKVSLRH